MPAHRNRLIYVGCSMVLLLCIAGGIIITRYAETKACYKERAPLRSLVVRIDISQQEQLFDRFREYADRFSFAIRIRQTTPMGDYILVMTRKDVEVIGRNPAELGEYRIGFYNNDCIHPTVATDIDGLVLDLKHYLGEISNATIVEEE